MIERGARSQIWDPEGYERHARFVTTLGAAILDWLAPAAGEHILDLGCGDGVLTEQIACRGVQTFGVDSNPSMIEAARRRGLDVHLLSGEALTFEASFDAVFSNAALHWMRDPAAVARGVFQALRPGGRFVAEMGGHGNVAAIRTALYAVLMRHSIDAGEYDPWYFPTPGEQNAVLSQAGFNVDRIELVPRPTALPTNVEGWLETFANPFLVAVPAEQAQALVQEVAAVLANTLRDSSGRWTADYCRLRFKATKPNV